MTNSVYYRDCKNCGRKISILAKSGSIIIAARCPSCLEDFQNALIEVEINHE